MNAPQEVHNPPEKVCTIVFEHCLGGGWRWRSMVLRTHSPFFSSLFSVPLASAWVWPMGSPRKRSKKGGRVKPGIYFPGFLPAESPHSGCVPDRRS